MIYLVTNQTDLFESEIYERISVEKSLEIMYSWNNVQYDSETNGLDCHINSLTCIQFGNAKKDIQIVVDVQSIDILRYKNVLESKLIIGHNLKFDLQFLYNYEIIPLKVYDTMIIEQLRYLGYPPLGKPGGIGFNLSDTNFRYTGIRLDKDIREDFTWRGLDDATILYAANDVKYLENIAFKQFEWARNNSCLPALDVENNFVPVIAYLEWCGIRLDQQAWKEKMIKDEAKMSSALSSLNTYIFKYYDDNKRTDTTIEIDRKYSYFDKDSKKTVFYDPIPGEIQLSTPEYSNIETKESYITVEIPFKPYKINLQGDLFSGFNTDPISTINWNSSPQVIMIMKMLGFDTKVKDKKTGKYKDSVEAKHIKGQKGVNDEFLKLYLSYTEAAKVVSTYGQVYLDAVNPKTDRIHTTFRQLGADTGRMACGSAYPNKDLAKYKKLLPTAVKYVQLQNLPADKPTRSAFISGEGNLMVSCDYSALEARLGADIYEEPAMIEEFLHGSGDMHSLVAKMVFPEVKDVPVTEIKEKFPEFRKRAKPVGLKMAGPLT